MKRYLLFGMIGLIVVAIVGTAIEFFPFDTSSLNASADPDNPQQVATGEAVYLANCARCHGASLQGEPNWRLRLPSGELPAPPLDGSGHTWHHPDGQLFTLIKAGPAALVSSGYKSNMPAFEDNMTDDELWAVLAYVKSKWPMEMRTRQEDITRRNQ